MLSVKLGLLALLAQAAQCYLDTSPFLIFSTSEILIPSAQLQSARSLTSQIAESLSECRSDVYILVSQAGVSSKDYANPKNSPSLAQRINPSGKSPIRSSASIAEVVGTIDTARWQEVLRNKCGAQLTHIDASTGIIPTTFDESPQLFTVDFPIPSGKRTESDLSLNDAFLASIIDTIESKKYTVLYTTTPNSGPRELQTGELPPYEMDNVLEDVMHTDLKRDLDVHRRKSSSNQTLVDGPLFEKYQFLSPGIFMGYLAGLLLLFILYCAISGLSSLQVSYAAFDKETTQAVQKKAQ